ncbi:MAG: amidohydrolase family protein [Rhizobiaceae bacterium]
MQSQEFSIRAQVLPAADIVASATVNSAKLLRMESKVGWIEPDTIADLTAVRGNRSCMSRCCPDREKKIATIMKDGVTICSRPN